MLKKIAILTSLLIATTAHAVYPGYYLGLIAGEAYTNYTASNRDLNSANVTNSGFAGGIFAGYQYNVNFGGEVAFVQFPSTKFNGINGTNNDGSINENALEIFIKGTSPISNNGFSISGKIGAAYMMSRTSNSINVSNGDNQNNNRVLPAYGAGISYDVMPYLPFELSWTRIQSGGGIQNADLVGLSVTYFFG